MAFAAAFAALWLFASSDAAFNWYALDIDTAYGSPDTDGYHHIVLWGELDAKKHNLAGFGADYAAAAVGKRTLIIEPVKFPTGSY